MASQSQDFSGDPVLDETHLGQLIDLDVDAAADIASIFLKESPELLEKLESALNDDDRKQIEFHAHRICGTSGNIGGKRTSMIARAIEEGAVHAPRNDLPELFEILKQECVSLAKAVEELVKRARNA